jgi:hypothetical protein
MCGPTRGVVTEHPPISVLLTLKNSNGLRRCSSCGWLRQLLRADASHGDQRTDRDAACLGEVIVMRIWNLADKAMGASLLTLHRGRPSPAMMELAVAQLQRTGLIEQTEVRIGILRGRL